MQIFHNLSSFPPLLHIISSSSMPLSLSSYSQFLSMSSRLPYTILVSAIFSFLKHSVSSLSLSLSHIHLMIPSHCIIHTHWHFIVSDVNNMINLPVKCALMTTLHLAWKQNTTKAHINTVLAYHVTILTDHVTCSVWEFNRMKLSLVQYQV